MLLYIIVILEQLTFTGGLSKDPGVAEAQTQSLSAVVFCLGRWHRELGAAKLNCHY